MNPLARFGDWLLKTFGEPCAHGPKANSFDVNKIRLAKWHQGAMFSPDAVAWLCKRNILPIQQDDGIWCVITQDCDLVHHDLRNEPVIEVIYGQQVDKPDKGYSWSKNARTLHVRDDDEGKSFAFHSRDRRTIPRGYLCRFKPLPRRLAPETVKLLVRWVARKYFRAAFPDNFNKRINRKTEDKIKRLLSKSKGQLKEIHINVSSKELKDSDDYKVLILCVGEAESAEGGTYEATLQIGTDLEKLLDSCDGIKVVKCEVRFPDEVTLEDLEPMDRWDFDSITIRESDSVDDAPVDR